MVFFSVKSDVASTDATTTAPWRWRLQLGLASLPLLALVALHLDAAGTLKRRVDHYAGMDAVLEKALRAGWMKPSELSFAPFGFVAWHLLPYYLTHEGKTSADLGGFGQYVDREATEIRIGSISRADAKAELAHNVPTMAPPFSEIHPSGWFGYARFSVARTSRRIAAESAIDWSEYQFQKFPLNDSEWRELVRSSMTSRPLGGRSP